MHTSLGMTVVFTEISEPENLLINVSQVPFERIIQFFFEIQTELANLANLPNCPNFAAKFGN